MQSISRRNFIYLVSVIAILAIIVFVFFYLKYRTTLDEEIKQEQITAEKVKNEAILKELNTFVPTEKKPLTKEEQKAQDKKVLNALNSFATPTSKVTTPTQKKTQVNTEKQILDELNKIQ